MPDGVDYGKVKRPVRRLTKKREVTAMALPNRSQVSDLAGSLSRGRLPEGSMLGRIVSALRRPGVPSSADPIGQGRRAISAAAASTAGGIQPYLKGPTRKTVGRGNRPRTLGPFNPKVRLNPDRVTDERRVQQGLSSNTKAPARRRRRLSGPTTGPRPSVQ